jgi:hypothetical protein
VDESEIVNRHDALDDDACMVEAGGADVRNGQF